MSPFVTTLISDLKLVYDTSIRGLSAENLCHYSCCERTMMATFCLFDCIIGTQCSKRTGGQSCGTSTAKASLGIRDIQATGQREWSALCLVCWNTALLVCVCVFVFSCFYKHNNAKLILHSLHYLALAQRLEIGRSTLDRTSSIWHEWQCHSHFLESWKKPLPLIKIADYKFTRGRGFFRQTTAANQILH